MSTKINGAILKNYTLYMGDDFARSFLIKVNGSLEDVSGDTFKMRIKNATTGVTFLDLETGSGIENPSTGRIVWTITAAQTAGADPRDRYKYDLQWTRSTGRVITIQKGLFTPEKDTTPA